LDVFWDLVIGIWDLERSDRLGREQLHQFVERGFDAGGGGPLLDFRLQFFLGVGDLGNPRGGLDGDDQRLGDFLVLLLFLVLPDRGDREQAGDNGKPDLAALPLGRDSGGGAGGSVGGVNEGRNGGEDEHHHEHGEE
jgi:hypothetical protein